MFKAMLELDFKFVLNLLWKYRIEFYRSRKTVRIYLEMTIDIDVQSYVGTGF